MDPGYWYFIATVLTLIGLAGTVLPLLPGVPLVFAGLALAAWVDGFEKVSVLTVVVLGGFTLMAMLIDFAASAFGTRIAGASRWAFLGAALGAVIGIFFGPIGLFVGPFVGAVVLEIVATQNIEKSVQAGVGASVGILLGAVAKIALAFTMIGLFGLAWWL
jgi:uncharacterized protein YqgC (DUF456 family)